MELQQVLAFLVRQEWRIRDVSAQVHSVMEDSQDVQHLFF
jgi:hypothetical protein